MKRIILLLICLLCQNIYGQSLHIFNIDKSKFPIMKAKFYAFDANGKQILNLDKSDFELIENGKTRPVSEITCPPEEPSKIVSLAMSIDVSGSMTGSDFGEIPVELGKSTARDLCNYISMPPSEFALQTCDANAMIVQDFTTNKGKILSAIDPIIAGGDNNFVEHLLNPRAGLLNVAKAGKNSIVAVLYTDAWWQAMTDDDVQRCKDTCAKYDIKFCAVIYSRPEAEPNGIKLSLKEIADASGGFIYDGITSKNAAQEIAQNIKSVSQGGDPCEITWMSGVNCVADTVDVDIKVNSHNVAAKFSYYTPANAVAKIVFLPKSVRFKNPPVGVKIEKKVTIKAINSDFDITDVVSTNKAFEITPTKFALNAGQSQELTVSYVPADSGYASADFDFINKKCSAMYYAVGGWRGRKLAIRTLKLIRPNGGEEFVVGSDTVITWEGVPPDEPVRIEYTVNNGSNWTKIIDSAMNYEYSWKVPNTPSNQCLARVTSNANDGELEEYPEAIVCGKIWMAENLHTSKYRNGDSIRYAETADDWADAAAKGEGAWCYPDNDPANGEIYGKLYNWFAVADPRGLAPNGWHVASRAEWEVSCSEYFQGGQLKATGTIEAGDGLWKYPNTGATDEFGFSVIPAGIRYDSGGFDSPGDYTRFWTINESNASNAWASFFSYNMMNIEYLNNPKSYGFSVRCVKETK